MSGNKTGENTVNEAGTSGRTGARLTHPRSCDVRRHEREAWALAIVKAIRKSPGEPERDVPLRATQLPGTDSNAPGVIYFVYSCGRIKIGYTSELASRMSQFGTHSPMPPVLLLTVGAHEQDEAASAL